jgi:hypothetical protein
MSVSDATTMFSRSVIGDYKYKRQSDDSRGVIFNRNIFIIPATGARLHISSTLTNEQGWGQQVAVEKA